MTDETTDELMSATYRALCKHGYADVTMQDIADETDKSKAALHYHYESKHDLLLSFLDYLLEEFTTRLATVSGDTPTERLHNTFDAVLIPQDGETDQEFRTAILEIKAQSPYDEAFREKLVEFDQRLFEHFRDLIAAGVAQGEFRSDVDPDTTANFFVTAFNGAQTRQAAVGHPVEQTQRVLERYVETRLVTVEDTEVTPE